MTPMWKNSLDLAEIVRCQFGRQCDGSAARNTQLRKDNQITQVQLAQTLGVSQPTVNAYELGQRRVPVSALPLLARTLGVSLEDLVGTTPSTLRKRGPASKLQQHLERISALPKPRQRAVMDVIEAMLAQPSR